MEKYSVLLVDDEEDVIQIIMKKMDWESMGFQIAGYAHNGVEALEMAEELQPDVVMTDIKMPYMDGLTLSRKLKELYRTVKIIIFSGFDEFEYAKEAIQIEVEEYILKPIDAGNLKEVFGRIHEKIGREMDEKRNVDKLREYYMESLPILQENFYTSLIDGRIPEGEVEKYLSNYQIDLTGPLLCSFYFTYQHYRYSTEYGSFFAGGISEKAGRRTYGRGMEIKDSDVSGRYCGNHTA